MADEVGPHISPGVFEAVADSGLGSEMNDPVYPERGRSAAERLKVREIHALEMEGAVVTALEPVEAVQLQPRVVIIVEIVDSEDGLAALEQRIRGRCSDEPRDAGDQNSHGPLIGIVERPRKKAIYCFGRCRFLIPCCVFIETLR